LFGKTETLFVSNKGKRAYPKLIYSIIHNLLANNTSLTRKSPHVLRHTFATHLSNNGAELNAVKELLGHASLASTQVYTHNTIDKLKEIHRLAHPKA
jgi:integrase/recombinase XerC